jgi:hypothetical protein
MMDMAAEETSSDTRQANKKATGETARTLQNITALIALASFCFGIGTWADLRHRFAPTANEVLQKYAGTYRQQYLSAADAACNRAASKGHQATPTNLSYDWMMSILTVRRHMATDRSLVGLASVEYVDVPAATDAREMQYDFVASNAFWAATADDLKAANVAGYNTNLGLFTTTEGTFVTEARRFGLKTCSFAWPSVPPWQ